MKRFKKIILLVVCFSFLLLNVNAASNSCDYTVGYVKKGGSISITDQTYNSELVLEEGELVHSYQEYASLLHNTGWNTYAYKCVVEGGSCTKVNTECSFDSATVATWQCYKSIASTCNYTYSGLKGYSWSSSGPCTTRVPVPCEEPPAILCKADCSVSKCYNWVDPGAYCSGSTGGSQTLCEANGGTWYDPPGYDARNNSYKETCGGGSTDTVTEAECKAKLDDYDCDTEPTCELFYRSEYMTCTPGQCNRVPFEVKGAHDFVYAVNTGSGGPHVTAYCANPSHNPLIEQSAWSKEINILNCAASDSSLDCGVANIMSEAYYRNQKVDGNKYNNHVVSLAIRLWYAYKEQSGFNSMGIAEEDSTTINSMDDFLAYIPGPDGKFPNVYKKTLDGIRRQLFFSSFSSITGNDYDFTGLEISDLHGISCSSNNMGVYCNGSGSNGSTYTYAAYLFINTVQGNPYMKEHFLSVLGGTSEDLEGEELVSEISKIYNDPIYYQVTLSPDGKTAIVNYELRETVNISCNELNIEGCDTPDQTLIFKDLNGDVIDSVLIEKYDYCDKNYCRAEVELTYPIVECGKVSQTELKFKGKKECGSSAIRKYIPCAGLDDYQIMYSFENLGCSNNITEEDKTLTSTLECEGECKQETDIDLMEFNCSNIYDYDANKYNGGNMRTSGSGYYTKESDVDPMKYKKVPVKYKFNNKYLNYTISDPSLTCILNKNSASKDYYDYSTYFGVNTNFCRVYCSDSVEYYLPPRTEISNSLQLLYDVVPGKKYDGNYLISNVKTRRNCVSKINYDDFSFSGKTIKWNEAYGLDESIVILNWKNLYDAVYDLSKTQGDKKDFLHNLVYDLYNCNFFTDAQIKNAGVIKPESAGKNSREYVSEYLNRTTSYCNGNNCTSGETKFQGGAEYIDHIDEITHVGGNYVKTGHPNLSNHSSVKNSVTFKYCEYNTDKCFAKDEDAENPFEDKFDEKAKSSSYMSNIAGLSGVQIPVNDYVIFSYEVDGVVYNDTSYQVEPQTGKVQVYNPEHKEKYNKNAENTFPISYYSDALCQERQVNYDINKDGNVNSKDKQRYCKIDVNVYNHIYTTYNTSLEKNLDANVNAFYRKNTDDAFIQTIKKSSNYTCEFTMAAEKEQLGFVFRNIELSSPVPTSNGTRENTPFENSNWDVSAVYCLEWEDYDNKKCKEGKLDKTYNNHLKDVIDQIKTSSEDLYGRNKYLEYSFILDDDSIRNIRNYNDTNKNYASIEVIDEGTGEIKDSLVNCKKKNGKYFECESDFLDQLNSLEVKVIKDDGLSLFTYCKNNPSGEGCIDE